MNYDSWARSNYFQVKDNEAFEAWCTLVDVQYEKESRDDGSILYGFISDNGSWPVDRYDEVTEEDVEVDFFAEVSEHLKDGYVAVFMEVGHEGMRYLSASAYAINNKGESEEIYLDQIYEVAKKLGSKIGDCSY